MQGRVLHRVRQHVAGHCGGDRAASSQQGRIDLPNRWCERQAQGHRVALARRKRFGRGRVPDARAVGPLRLCVALGVEQELIEALKRHRARRGVRLEHSPRLGRCGSLWEDEHDGPIPGRSYNLDVAGAASEIRVGERARIGDACETAARKDLVERHRDAEPVSYTHLRAHETLMNL
eukprot:6285011-Prymnesium_polylepis.1